MNEIKNRVAKNITELRLANNMTQIELGAKLNYSDKTVSKWERAESSPDISVLVEMSELFGVSLDYLVKGEEASEPEEIKENEEDEAPDVGEKRYNRRAIAYISESVPWIIAVAAFIITTLILRRTAFQWLYFVYALPIVLIIKLVFNSVWFNPRHNYGIISAMIWSILATIHTTFVYFGIDVALIYLLGVAGQIVVILWSFIKKPKNKG